MTDAKMEQICHQDSYRKSCEAKVVSADPQGVRLDRTVFYAMGGGQPGDSGHLKLPDGSVLRILDTRKGAGPGDVLHLSEADAPLPAPGTAVTADGAILPSIRLCRCDDLGTLFIREKLLDIDIRNGLCSQRKCRNHEHEIFPTTDHHIFVIVRADAARCNALLVIGGAWL